MADEITYRVDSVNAETRDIADTLEVIERSMNLANMIKDHDVQLKFVAVAASYSKLLLNDMVTLQKLIVDTGPEA